MRPFLLLIVAMTLAACADVESLPQEAPVAVQESAPPEPAEAGMEPQSPPIEEPASKPPPVRIEAVLSVSAAGAVLSGSTNLPDGAVLEHNVVLYCWDEACEGLDDLTDEQWEVMLSGRGPAVVSNGSFSVDLIGWNTVPACGWNTNDSGWMTDILVSFSPSASYAEAWPDFAQPDSILNLYGNEGQALQAEPPAARNEFLPIVSVRGSCSN